jgi:hypothetical protein
MNEPVMPAYRAEIIQVVIGIVALLIGVLVYLLDRPAGSVYFLPEWLVSGNTTHAVFKVIGNYLPTFVHVYAFILFTVAVMAPTTRMLLIICSAWFAIDSLFELAQIDSIADYLSGVMPGWFNGIPFLENTTNYFVYGTFDSLDILSIALGTVAAYATVVIINKKYKHQTSALAVINKASKQ